MTKNIVYFISQVLGAKIEFSELKHLGRKNNQGQIIIQHGEQIGIDDRGSCCGYFRYYTEPDHEYQEITGRRFTSAQSSNKIRATAKLRLVISHRFENEISFEKYVCTSLRAIQFNDYSGNEEDIRIEVNASSTDKEYIFTEETDKEPEENNSNAIRLLLVDFEVSYNISDDCNDGEFEDECFVYEGVICKPVSIYRDGEFIETVAAGGEYRYNSAFTCDPANISINGTSVGTVASGGSQDYRVVDTAENNVGALDAGKWKIDDSIVLLNGTQVITLRAEQSVDIPITNMSGDPIGAQIGTGWLIYDVTVELLNSDGSMFFQDLRPGTSPQINITDCVYNIEDTDGNLIDTGNIPAQQSETIVIPDGDVTVNGNPFNPILAAGSLNVPVKNTNGTALGSQVGNDIIIQNTPIKNTAGTLQSNAPSGEDYIVPDDSVTNSDASVTFSNIVQGVQKVLPDVTITANNSENTTVKTQTSPSMKSVTMNLDDINIDGPWFDLIAWPNGKPATITVNVLEYTTVGSETYNTPDNLLFAEIIAIPGGGAGGSGRRGASASNRYGGGGGSRGPLARRVLTKAQIGASQTITIGSGGTGGAAVSVDSTNGNAGTDGGDTSFGTLVVAKGGKGGTGGTAAAGTGGAAVANSVNTPTTFPQSIPTAAGGNGAAGNATISTVIALALMGGGGGGGINSLNTQGNGGAGDTLRKNDGTLNTARTGGHAASNTAALSSLNNQWTSLSLVLETVLNTIGLGTSGAGGYGNLADGGGENWEGANGGLYGGAGGGGGAGVNGTTNGAKGGNGAQGAMIIFEFLIS